MLSAPRPLATVGALAWLRIMYRGTDRSNVDLQETGRFLTVFFFNPRELLPPTLIVSVHRQQTRVPAAELVELRKNVQLFTSLKKVLCYTWTTCLTDNSIWVNGRAAFPCNVLSEEHPLRSSQTNQEKENVTEVSSSSAFSRWSYRKNRTGQNRIYRLNYLKVGENICVALLGSRAEVLLWG